MTHSEEWTEESNTKFVPTVVNTLSDAELYYLEYVMASRYPEIYEEEFDVLRNALSLLLEVATTGAADAYNAYRNYTDSNVILKQEDTEGNCLLDDLRRFALHEILPALESRGLVRNVYKIPVIATRDEIKALPSNVISVHLASSSVLSKACMKELMEGCPFLRFVQLRPSFRLLLGKSSERVLAENGVVLVYRSRRPNYDKRFRFNRMFLDSDKIPWLKRMEAANLPEYLIAKYYCSRSDITMEETAVHFDLTLEKARRLWYTFCSWMGYKLPRCYVERYDLNVERKLLLTEEAYRDGVSG